MSIYRIQWRTKETGKTGDIPLSLTEIEARYYCQQLNEKVPNREYWIAPIANEQAPPPAPVQLSLEAAKQIIAPTITRIVNLLSEQDAAAFAAWLAETLDIDPPLMVTARPQLCETAGGCESTTVDYLA
jgi:hypothetical protein